jgi:SWI/SNF-related matrix-associated actin-dependent regulator 1 of chromatin subfamily A
MVRRLKKDVLLELPPKRRQIIAIPPDSVKKVVEAELDFYQKNIHLIEEAKDELEKAKEQAQLQTGDEASYKLAASKMKTAKQLLFEQLASLRYMTAMAKVPFAINYIEDLLEQEDKLVVFCHHHDVRRALLVKFNEIAVQHHGEMTAEQKQVAVNKFMTDPKCKLFLGSITVALGYTVTVASTAVLVEVDWRPSVVTQAEDRLHRIGQKEAVLIQHLCFDSSLDAIMVKRIIEKQEIIDSALDLKKEKK